MTARARRATLLLALSLTVGAAEVSPPVRLRDWLAGHEVSLRDTVILVDIRLPRLLTGVLVGAVPAVAGAVSQPAG